jgi:hypothetical protein
MNSWPEKLAAILFGLIASLVLLAGLFSGYALFDTTGAKEDRKVLQGLKQTERFVQTFQTHAGRLPNEGELNDWATAIALEPNPLGRLEIHSTHFHACTDKDDHFEATRGDRFVLATSRGNWWEWLDCYSSPSGKNTLTTSEGEWLKGNLISGGPICLGLLALAGALFFIAFRMYFGKPLIRQAASSS